MYVKATPIHKHKRAVALLNKGVTIGMSGVKSANINFDTSRYIYKIIYENDKFNEDVKLFFKADKSISKAVNEGIVNG